MYQNGIVKDYNRSTNYARIMNVDTLSLTTVKKTLKEKQNKLEELRIENKQYPSDYTERQMARIQSIIATLQETIIRETERGKK